MNSSIIHETLKEHLEILGTSEVGYMSDRQNQSLTRIVELTRTIVAENLLKE
jgi:hypothetical protein